MEIQRKSDPRAFLELIEDHLLSAEALNNIFFGVIGDAHERPHMYPGDNLWTVAVEGDDVVGASMRTPPWPIAFTQGTSLEAAQLLMEFAVDVYDDDTFDFRTRPEVAEALSPLLAARGFVVTPVEAQGIYKLDRVIEPRAVLGRARLATTADIELAAIWAVAFSVDVDHGLPGDQAARAAALARSNIDSGHLYLWEFDGEPTSMAAVRGPTPNGIRVSLVYTPPEHRGNGYASALVAHVSQQMLDAGRTFVFLFTDLANPTSNRIYRAVGFERVGEETLFRATRA